MIYREFGRTKLQVSALALGTVALGTPYGFAPKAAARQPSRGDAIALIKNAVAQGITLVDTAPVYGTAESLVGAAVGDDASVIIATKVTVPATTESAGLRKALEASLESSRAALRRDKLDIVQIHNATPASLALPEVGGVLRSARAEGVIRFLGASVYTADEALAAIASGWIDVLQVPFNVLDQRITSRVLDAARAAGVGVLSRSALLKGALTERASSMPSELDGLRRGADRARQAFGATWGELPSSALRFCLSDPRVSSVLVGASTKSELEVAIAAVDAGPLSDDLREVASGLAITDERLIDPRLWPAT